MADAAVSMALQTLYDLLVEEGKFLVNVSNQVEEVKRELNTMHCFLKDADNWPDRYNSETVRNWVAELKDLACDAEDVLEKYAIKVTSRREGKNLKKVVKRFTCIFSECLSVHEVGNEIEAIRTRMANLTRRLENIVKADSSAAAADDNQRQLRQTYAHQVEEHFVGMQDDIGRLVSLAVSDGRANRVISICGMGGLGKTTLARKIYKHEDVERVFQARAWVCLTQQFETKAVLQRILKQLDSSARNQELMEMDENELVVQLYYVQMTKKCLVVIDDIWTLDHWDILRPAFPVVEGSCKVLLTTRNEQIAAEECVYKLGYLTEDQCWELLQKIALPQASVREVTHESKELEDIGRDLIHKCGRLPLAISVIGGILREKQSVGEWKKVKANFDKRVQYGDGTEKERRVAQVLDLSYNALPYHLKPCFLYLGIYSEDEEIDAEKVLLQWMAEGMISSEMQGTEETLRDVAQLYLSELASRCMVQVKVLDYPSLHKRFESCRLHDLMRDLCLTKAKEEGFLENMDFYFPKDYCSSTIKTRRLAIHFQGDVGDDFNGIEKLTNLRCLYIDNKLKYPEVCDIGYHNLVSNLDKFKSLRVLILVTCDLREGIIPSDIGYKLIHLRYLGFRDCLLDELPLSITNFPCLQTLELEIYHGSHTKIPNVLYKMRRLKHLFLQYVQPYEEQLYGEYLRLDGLNELETFDKFKTIYYDPSDIPKLTNLRYFKALIINESSLSVLVNHISDSKTKLCETILNIANCDFGSEEGSALLRKMLVSPSLARVLIDGRICRLPSCEPDDRLCPSLVDLTLCFSVIENDPMEILERLPMLKKLRLLDQAFVGSKMVCHASGFPQLRYLLLAGLPHLEEWKVEEGAMPNLSTIVIFNCGRLKMIPNGLRFITSLQKLQIVSMPKEFEDRLQKVDGEQGEDYDKVSHISSILFGGEFDYETWLNYK
ncbi:putative disease resistance protein [Sesamum alatum]|uniref:Disease resistance protein n=1 Tax=Sesamum alatum TaxID=300844 RepID=A0AAE1Y0P6_9LAMI|nr:putative disease resistance protein [Sesamum alatum]